jgi:hypothetical protein
MIIRNSIALGGALAAGATPSLLLIGAMTCSPWLGAAAFTSTLASLGGSMITGLLGLMVISVVAALVAYIIIQIQLAWLPV